jgi:hypothetical protein
MKTCFSPCSLLRLLLGLGLAFGSGLRAQDAASGNPELLTPPQIDKLLGPIALYPDALVALILPASTVPTDVVLTARYLNGGGDPAQVDNQPWNESIKALARYPVLVKWMDENLQWTTELGSAFLNQPSEVMNSVQRLRARARTTGALTSTPQQQVVLDGDLILIVPAEPDVIYVPYYDPEVVYYRQPGYYSAPYLTFGFGFPIGFWLCYDFDWHTRVILVGDRHHNWQGHRDWDRHAGGDAHPRTGNWRAWQAPATRPQFARPANRQSGGEMARPRPLPGAPSGTRDAHLRDNDRSRSEGNSRDHRVGSTPSAPLPETSSAPVLSSPTRPAQVPASIQGGTHDPRDRRTATPPLPESSPPLTAQPRPASGPSSVFSSSQDSRDRRSPSSRPSPLPDNRPSAASVPIPVPVPASQPPPIPTRIQSSGPMPTPLPQSNPAARVDSFRPPSRPQPATPEPRQYSPTPPRPANPPPPPPAPANPKDRTKEQEN